MIFLLDLSRRFIEVEVVGGEAEQGREADFWMLSSPHSTTCHSDIGLCGTKATRRWGEEVNDELFVVSSTCRILLTSGSKRKGTV